MFFSGRFGPGSGVVSCGVSRELSVMLPVVSFSGALQADNIKVSVKTAAIAGIKSFCLNNINKNLPNFIDFKITPEKFFRFALTFAGYL